MNNSLFKYLMKSKKTAIIFIFVVYALLYSMVYAIVGLNEAYILSLAIATVIAFILSVVLIPISFCYVHNKKAVDSYFSLPISRKEQLITTELFCDLVILIPVVLLTGVSLVINYISGEAIYLYAYLFYLVLMIVGISVITLFNTATFLQANSTFDGIVMIFAYLLIPIVLLVSIEVFASAYIYGFEELHVNGIISIISIIYANFVALVQSADCMLFGGAIEYGIIIRFLICVALHLIVSVAALKSSYINRKVERAETISNEFTSYPFVIYFYVFSLLFITVSINKDNSFSESIILFVLIFVAFEIANCVYKRKIKIEIKNVCFFLLSVGIAFLIGIIAFKTEGFGLAHQYEKNPKNAFYEVSINNLIYQNDEIDKKILEMYPDSIGYDLSIDVNVKSASMEKEKEIIDFFDKKRVELIDNYYHNEYGENIGRFGTLTIINNFIENKNNIITDIFDANEIRYIYSYNNISLFSLDDLVFIDKFGDVKIYVSTSTDVYALPLVDILKD